MTPSEATLAWVRGRADKLYDVVTTTGIRLGTWLLVGNVAALVLLLQTAVGGGVTCDPASLMEAGRRFAFGLSLAFGAWVISYAGSVVALASSEAGNNSLATSVANEKYIDRLEERFGEHYQPGGLEADMDTAGNRAIALSKRARWLLVPSGIAYTLFAFSAWHFAQGVFAVLAADAMATCAAG